MIRNARNSSALEKLQELEEKAEQFTKYIASADYPRDILSIESQLIDLMFRDKRLGDFGAIIAVQTHIFCMTELRVRQFYGFKDSTNRRLAKFAMYSAVRIGWADRKNNITNEPHETVRALRTWFRLSERAIEELMDIKEVPAVENSAGAPVAEEPVEFAIAN